MGDLLVVLHFAGQFVGGHVVTVRFDDDDLLVKYFGQLQLLKDVGNGGLHQ